jgi:hypothetical protein
MAKVLRNQLPAITEHSDHWLLNVQQLHLFTFVNSKMEHAIT